MFFFSLSLSLSLSDINTSRKQRHNNNNRHSNGNRNNNGFRQQGTNKPPQPPPKRINARPSLGTTPLGLGTPTIHTIKDDYGSSNDNNQGQNQDYDYYNNNAGEEYIDILPIVTYDTGDV